MSLISIIVVIVIMMKYGRNKIHFVKLLIASAVFLLAITYPALSDVYSSYSFNAKYFISNERIDYTIKSLDEKAHGKTIVSMRKIKQMDTDMFLIRYEGNEGEMKEKWEAKVKIADLSPVSYEKTIEKPKYSASYTGVFHGDNMTLSFRATDREPREIVLSRGIKFYFSMLMPHLLRNIDFKKGDYYTFSLLLVEDGKFTTPIIQVKEKEVIQVPAGMYECWKLNIKLGTEQHYGWYSVKEPHYLIKYSYPGKELIMEKHS